MLQEGHNCTASDRSCAGVQHLPQSTQSISMSSLSWYIYVPQAQAVCLAMPQAMGNMCPSSLECLEAWLLRLWRLVLSRASSSADGALELTFNV